MRYTSLSPEIPGKHHFGHGGEYEGSDNVWWLTEIHHQHALMAARLIERLKATPEGDGTAWDNTLLVYTCDGGESHHANFDDWIVVAASGRNIPLQTARGGRHVLYPKLGSDRHRQLSNFWNTVGHAVGASLDDFGLEGAIRIAAWSSARAAPPIAGGIGWNWGDRGSSPAMTADRHKPCFFAPNSRTSIRWYGGVSFPNFSAHGSLFGASSQAATCRAWRSMRQGADGTARGGNERSRRPLGAHDGVGEHVTRAASPPKPPGTNLAPGVISMACRMKTRCLTAALWVAGAGCGAYSSATLPSLRRIQSPTKASPEF